MHPGMLALRELNEHIGNLRDVRVSQVVRDGSNAEIVFPAFAVRLHDVVAFRGDGVEDAPLAAGIAFINQDERVELWLDDVEADGSVHRRLCAVASRASLDVVRDTAR